MASNDNEFNRLRTKKLLYLDNEEDPEKKVHLQRTTNIEMYHEACARNLPKPFITSMIHNDTVDYTKSTSKVFVDKFNAMFSNLATHPNPPKWKCTLSVPEPQVIRSPNDSKKKLPDCVDAERQPAMNSRIPATVKPSGGVEIVEGDDSDDEGLTFNFNFQRREHSNVQPNKFQFNDPKTTARPVNIPQDNTANKSTDSWQDFASNKRKCDDGWWYTTQRMSWFNRPKVVRNEEETAKPSTIFKTATDELAVRYEKKYGHGTGNSGADSGSSSSGNNYNTQPSINQYGTSRKTLGGRRTVASPFVPPMAQAQQMQKQNDEYNGNDNDMNDDRLKNIDPKMIELIRNEIMDRFAPIAWGDIAGLSYAKTIIQEAVVWPLLRPDLFTGLRRPPRGILLFGPPGTGKTLIGKCIASQSNSTFFSISASSLTSKWVGEAEKMVRTLFAVASVHQPAVIFIDEIDSLLSQRSESEHESSRKIKTEFLVRLDGTCTAENERILIVGATNRPQELDEAARRRFTKRLYIPLPETDARQELLHNLLKNERKEINEQQITTISRMTDGYSGADLKVLCQEASMGPIRSIPMHQINLIDVNDVRPLNYDDFQVALKRVRASVSPNDLEHYIEWDRTYGSGAGI